MKRTIFSLIVLALTIYSDAQTKTPDYETGVKLPLLEKLILNRMNQMRSDDGLKPLSRTSDSYDKCYFYAYDLALLYRVEIEKDPSNASDIISLKSKPIHPWPTPEMEESGIRITLVKKYYSPGNELNTEYLENFIYYRTIVNPAMDCSGRILDPDKSKVSIASFTSKVFNTSMYSAIVINVIIYIQ